MITTIAPVCRKCVTMKKSGKKTCCGRGGAWFKKCGNSRNTKLEHTWYEGIRACKARGGQYKVAMGLQLKASKPDSRDFSNNVDTILNPKAVIAAGDTFAPTSTSMPTPIPEMTPIITTSIDSMTDPAQSPALTSAEYDIGTTNPEAIVAAEMASPSSNMSSPLDIVVKLNSFINTLVNASIRAPMDKPLNMIMAPSHTSASTSVITKGCEQLLYIATHATVLIITVF